MSEERWASIWMVAPEGKTLAVDGGLEVGL